MCNQIHDNTKFSTFFSYSFENVITKNIYIFIFFSSKNGKEARLSDISEMTGLSLEEIVEAVESIAPVTSLSAVIGEGDELTVENTAAVSDNPFDEEIEKMALYEALGTLQDTWKKIIVLRYFKSLSQQETADRLGLTQVKISREEKKIFKYLREQLEG